MLILTPKYKDMSEVALGETIEEITTKVLTLYEDVLINKNNYEHNFICAIEHLKKTKFNSVQEFIDYWHQFKLLYYTDMFLTNKI